MKNMILLFYVFLFCPLVKAQDIILKIDHTEVLAKVTEITNEEVKFKYFDRLDGPTYILKKSDVFTIIYKDGTREKFNPVASTSAENKSNYSEKPVSKPVLANVVAVSQTSSTPDMGKRKGWTGNLGYGTALQGIGQASAIDYGGGYYFLRANRNGGILIDLDVINFFGEGTPNYGVITVNGLLRPSGASSFYLGGGLGYANVSVKVKDRYGLTSTVSSGDLGGKAFMGYGLFRMSIVWPSFQGRGGGLLTIGLSTNPFK